MENTTSNGVPGQRAAGSDDARRQATQRAEELVDRWAAQIGQWAAAFGHNVLKCAARAREEAEDIWAEAQAIRQGQPLHTQAETTPPEKTASIWEEVQAIRKRHP